MFDSLPITVLISVINNLEHDDILSIVKCNKKLHALKKYFTPTFIIKKKKFIYSKYISCEFSYYNIHNYQLYDALCTGLDLPYVSSTFTYYDTNIESDIIFMINNCPELIPFKNGVLRCRDEVTVLCIACMNTNIPIYILQSLIQKGCSLYDTILLNGRPTLLKDDLIHNASIIGNERLQKILTLQ